MSSSFTQKLLEIDITLSSSIGIGPFAQGAASTGGTNQAPSFAGGGNTVTLSGFRTMAKVQHAGLPQGSTAQVEVYGLTPDLINRLSTLGLVFNVVPANLLSIRAGDAVSGLSIIFVGTIWSAVPDFNRSPESPVVFDCICGDLNAVAPAFASSYPQPTSVATIMSSLAARMGYAFENNGVNITLPPSYFAGSLYDQVKQVKDHANIVAELVPGALGSGQLTLAIWPKGGSRSSLTQVPLISPATGMVGYPIYSQFGLYVKTLFNPQITIGGLVQIESSLKQASGQWVVLDINHELSSLMPDGQWVSTLSCFNLKYQKYGIPVVS